MKILLIKPPQKQTSIFHILPPLGLGYLASSLRCLDTDLQIIDCVRENIGVKKLLDMIAHCKPDIVGFTAYTHDLGTVNILSSYIKRKIAERILIVVGGPHPSVAPEHTFQALRNIDFAFKGEAETGFRELVRYVMENPDMHGKRCENSLSRIPGLIYKDDSGVIKVNRQCYTEELDSLEFPDWRLIDPRKYLQTCHGVFYYNTPFSPIFTSRGCSQYCSFCSAHNIMGRKIRRRSVANVIKEIAFLRDSFGVREIHILDDNFTADKDYVLSFCKSLIDSSLNMSWSCPNGVRVDSLDEEMLDQMKASGCHSVFVGIESGSQRVLNAMNKHLNLALIEEKIGIIKKKGFLITGFFIVGYPQETKEEINETIEFSLKLPLDIADFSNFLPLPGSSVVEELFGAAGMDMIDSAALSSPANVIHYSKDRSEIRLRNRMMRKAYLRFYLRPRIMITLIRQIRSPYQVFYLGKRLIEYFFPAKLLSQRAYV
jgi:radical SAM superfamily enzyme YgiQ (UPF0313 family)